MRTSLVRLAALFAAVLIGALAVAAPAAARFHVGGRAGPANPNASMVIAATTGPGQTFGGLRAPAGFDPLSGYPASGYDTTGFTPVASGFGGVIHGTTPDGETLQLYCIDQHTSTSNGIPYDPSTWDATKVPHLGYVLRILTDYYPATGLPTGATSDAQRAAAVQAAIWFFTDDFVLATGDARYALTARIVTDVLAAGPLPEPVPSLTIAGPGTGTSGQLVGPFVVHGNATTATLTATGASLYSDEAGTQPIADGSAYPVGQRFWLRSNDPGTATVEATAVARTAIGRAFLYAPADPDDPDPADAQRLILAQPGHVRTTAVAHVDVTGPSASPSTSASASASGPASTTPSASGTSGGGSLPVTGTRLFVLPAVAAGLLVLGLATVLMARRRRDRGQ